MNLNSESTNRKKQEMRNISDEYAHFEHVFYVFDTK
jgi:hypothetical protein